VLGQGIGEVIQAALKGGLRNLNKDDPAAKKSKKDASKMADRCDVM
jgi:hypothetical protein